MRFARGASRCKRAHPSRLWPVIASAIRRGSSFLPLALFAVPVVLGPAHRHSTPAPVRTRPYGVEEPERCRRYYARPPNPPFMTGRSRINHVPKPWGHETIWAHTESYVGKILHIKAGEALSVQYHNVKDETVFLMSGSLIYRVWQNEQP